jgi:hypothetical protein
MIEWRCEVSYMFYDALVTAETDEAICIQHEDLDEDAWLPRSCVEDGHGMESGDNVDVEVSEWLARQRGWI